MLLCYPACREWQDLLPVSMSISEQTVDFCKILCLGLSWNLMTNCMHTILETCIQSFNKHFLGIYCVSGTSLRAWRKRWKKLLVKSESWTPIFISALSQNPTKRTVKEFDFKWKVDNSRQDMLTEQNSGRGRAGHVQSLIQVSASSALLSARRGQNHQASGDWSLRNGKKAATTVRAEAGGAKRRTVC